MVEILQVIEDAFHLYKKKWKTVITAFLVLLAIGILFGLISSGLNLSANALCKAKPAQQGVVDFLLCVTPQALNVGLGIIEGLIAIVITLAVIKPLKEIADKRPVSDWTANFTPQLANAVKVILFRFAVMLLVIAPVVAVALLNLPIILTAKTTGDLTGLLLFGNLFLLLIVMAVMILISAIINFFLMFLEIEIVLSNAGLINAVKKSASIVRNNLGNSLLFVIAWFVLNFVLDIGVIFVACTCCLLPLAILIPPLIIVPIELLSKVILWKRMKKKK